MSVVAALLDPEGRDDSSWRIAIRLLIQDSWSGVNGGMSSPPSAMVHAKNETRLPQLLERLG